MRVSEQGRRNQLGHIGNISHQVLKVAQWKIGFPKKLNSTANLNFLFLSPFKELFPFLTFKILFDQEDFLDFKDLGALPRQFFKSSGAPAELKLESSAPERRCRRHTILVVRSSCPARHQ